MPSGVDLQCPLRVLGAEVVDARFRVEGLPLGPSGLGFGFIGFIAFRGIIGVIGFLGFRV